MVIGIGVSMTAGHCTAPTRVGSDSTGLGDVERILKYFEKIRCMYCEGHDREFLKGEECPGCRSEHDDYETEAIASC